MLCGLITPDEGHLQLNGYDVSRQRSAAMSQIGVVLEGTRNVYWRLSGWENLMYFGRLKGRTARSLSDRGERLFRGLDLWERRRDPARTYSRGMQQKVAIACALIADPAIVLLDEPTLGLDVHSARTVKAWITQLVREDGKTVVLTTHQLQMAEELCDHIAIIRKGQLLAHEPVAKLLELSGDDIYQIRLGGPLNDKQLRAFTNLEAEQENGNTILSGHIADQESLHQVLGIVRQMGVPLLSVARIEPDLEEIFVRILAEDD